LQFFLELQFVFKKNTIPRISTVAVIIVVGVLWILYFTALDPKAIALRITCLFIGTINGLYSVIDIFDDTVDRTVQGSDATACAQIMGCPNSSQGIGFCWLVISIFLFVGAIIVNLLIVQPPHS